MLQRIRHLVHALPLHPLLLGSTPPAPAAALYNALAARGFVIYPGKLTRASCFRIGSIGRLFESDMAELVDAVEQELRAQGVALPVKQIEAV
jgi:2-aminoethylphosphonate-pyruvate transaminase